MSSDRAGSSHPGAPSSPPAIAARVVQESKEQAMDSFASAASPLLPSCRPVFHLKYPMKGIPNDAKTVSRSPITLFSWWARPPAISTTPRTNVYVASRRKERPIHRARIWSRRAWSSSSSARCWRCRAASTAAPPSITLSSPNARRARLPVRTASKRAIPPSPTTCRNVSPSSHDILRRSLAWVSPPESPAAEGAVVASDIRSFYACRRDPRARPIGIQCSRSPLGSKMFRALRKARFAQIVLLTAGVLAVSGSFGLHPEPEGSGVRVSSRGGWNALDRSGVAAPHDCFLCLAHKSISLPGLSAVVLQPGRAVNAIPAAAPSLLERLEGHPCESRAPPALT